MAKDTQLTGYELSRQWFDFSFENPDKIKPIHTAIYFFAIEHNNRLGWRKSFGFPAQMVMDALGIKNGRTYRSALIDLENFGFIKFVEKSTNQYSANIIALLKYDKALGKALDKAMIKHDTKHNTKQVRSIAPIDKQLTTNKEQVTKDSFLLFLKYVNTKLGKKYRFTDKVFSSYKIRLKEYTKDEIKKSVDNACLDSYHIENGFKYLTPEFLLREDKIEKFLNAQSTIRPKKKLAY